MGKLRYPVIGIPSWWWKPIATKFARKNPNIINVKSEGLAYECSRHIELLSMFDSGDTNYEKSEYFRYCKSNNKKDKSIRERISKFMKLYKSIENEGCKTPPIVTEDGCRLDGSHRISVVIHLGIENVNINLVEYDKIFPSKKVAEILASNKKYRQDYYKFEE